MHARPRPKPQVPEPQWPQTPVQLLATAGLRMLPGDASGALLQEARRLLGGSGFLFRDEWARVISGQEEGLFGWVSINYATGALQVRGVRCRVASGCVCVCVCAGRLIDRGGAADSSGGWRGRFARTAARRFWGVSKVRRRCTDLKRRRSSE
jgi:hypothetical protein